MMAPRGVSSTAPGATSWQFQALSRDRVRHRGRHAALAASLFIAVLTGVSSARLQRPALPPAVDAYLTSNVRLSASERHGLLSGAPLD